MANEIEWVEIFKKVKIKSNMCLIFYRASVLILESVKKVTIKLYLAAKSTIGHTRWAMVRISLHICAV